MLWNGTANITGAGAGGAGPVIAGPILLLLLKLNAEVMLAAVNKKCSIHTCVCTRTHKLSLHVHQCRQLIIALNKITVTKHTNGSALSSSLPLSSSTMPTGLSTALMPEKFYPPKSLLLPKRAFRSKGQMHSFRAKWCEKYSWLHYDNSTDAAHCYKCMKAEHGNRFLARTKRDPAFISKGFKNWKDATIALNTHLRSDYHKKGCEILELCSTTGDVAENVQGRE